MAIATLTSQQGANGKTPVSFEWFARLFGKFLRRRLKVSSRPRVLRVAVTTQSASDPSCLTGRTRSEKGTKSVGPPGSGKHTSGGSLAVTRTSVEPTPARRGPHPTENGAPGSAQGRRLGAAAARGPVTEWDATLPQASTRAATKVPHDFRRRGGRWRRRARRGVA